MIRKRGTPNDPTSQRALVIDGISVLHAMLDSLSEREAGVIAMRFGLTRWPAQDAGRDRQGLRSIPRTHPPDRIGNHVKTAVPRKKWSSGTDGWGKDSRNCRRSLHCQCWEPSL